MTDDAEVIQRWLHWWQQGYWQQADESWGENAFFALPADQQQRLAWQHPEAVAQGFGIEGNLPAEPDTRLLQLLSLSGEHWMTLLALLAGICAPQTAPQGLNGPTRVWCRRLAKALRCESWLPAEHFTPYTTGSLLLLRALNPASWPRMRLLFPVEWANSVDAVPLAALPAARLAGLWDAALWHCQQQESSLYVDNPQDHPAE